jgi:hypothetical protein
MHRASASVSRSANRPFEGVSLKRYQRSEALAEVECAEMTGNVVHASEVESLEGRKGMGLPQPNVWGRRKLLRAKAVRGLAKPVPPRLTRSEMLEAEAI